MKRRVFLWTEIVQKTNNKSLHLASHELGKQRHIRAEY